MNNEMCNHYLADCKPCTFAKDILKHEFYIRNMQNAYNPKPNEHCLAKGSLSIDVAKVYWFWNTGLNVGFALVPTISHLSVQLFLYKITKPKERSENWIPRTFNIACDCFRRPWLKKYFPVSIWQVAGWTQEPVRTLWWREKSLSLPQTEPLLPSLLSDTSLRGIRPQGFSGAKSINNIEWTCKCLQNITGLFF
jgi:hypothetical protein